MEETEEEREYTWEKMISDARLLIVLVAIAWLCSGVSITLWLTSMSWVDAFLVVGNFMGGLIGLSLIYGLVIRYANGR